jgi:hypothetical protein
MLWCENAGISIDREMARTALAGTDLSDFLADYFGFIFCIVAVDAKNIIRLVGPISRTIDVIRPRYLAIRNA